MTKCRVWIAAGIIALSGGWTHAEPSGCEPSQDCFLKRIGPVGGWQPYGTGMLHWWPRHCFPCGGAPDDYCRKPLPRVCWPPYPPFYIIGAPPEMCYPQSGCGHDRKLH